MYKTPARDRATQTSRPNDPQGINEVKNKTPTWSRPPPIHNKLGLHGCPGHLRPLPGQEDFAGVHRKWLSRAVAQQGRELQRSFRPIHMNVVISCNDEIKKTNKHILTGISKYESMSEW